jgi:hypothetical protein
MRSDSQQGFFHQAYCDGRLEKGDYVAINLQNNRAPIAVGRTQLSSEVSIFTFLFWWFFEPKGEENLVDIKGMCHKMNNFFEDFINY